MEQAPFDVKLYMRQFTGGINSFRRVWKELRKMGSSARQILLSDASTFWNIPQAEKPLFTLNYHQEIMFIVMAQRLPTFGLKLKSFNVK